MFTRAELEEAVAVVGNAVPPTPQHRWPLLDEATGCHVWVKHENHAPTGAFKVRGGVLHFHRRRAAGRTSGVITATRGNHGQSIAFAAGRSGIPATVVVPHGNSREKNAAMRALGAELVEAGHDFDAARAFADEMAEARALDFVPSFHPDLVTGVATYAYELFAAVSDLDVVYVPIGLGSGICGVIRVRDLFGLDTEVVGVVAERAPAYERSFAARRVVPTQTAATFADGVAVRQPDPVALDIIMAGASRIVTVGEDQIAGAIRLLYAATHNAAEGAGAAAVAALLDERDRVAGRRVGIVLTGGNIDSSTFAAILDGTTPTIDSTET
jgi:threonine dehydratase